MVLRADSPILRNPRRIPDDLLFLVGIDDDVALVLRSTALAANTALTGVLEGTPVTPVAIAANSLLIGNITNDGDIVVAVSKAGTSYMAFMADASTGNTLLGVPTGQSIDFYVAGAKVLDYAVGLATITPALDVLDATDATSTTAGAMKTAGGLAVAKRMYVGDNIAQMGVGAQSKILTVRGAALTASTGTVDLAAIASGGAFLGLLIVSNSIDGSASAYTHTAYFVTGRGTTLTANSLSTVNGAGGACAFSLSMTVNGTIRLTNTQANTATADMTFIGHSSP